MNNQAMLLFWFIPIFVCIVYLIIVLLEEFDDLSIAKTVKKIRRKRQTGVMNSSEVYFCPECNNKITHKELSATWDWAGPHCPHCGNTGVDMFASIIEQDCPNGIQHAK